MSVVVVVVIDPAVVVIAVVWDDCATDGCTMGGTEVPKMKEKITEIISKEIKL